MKTINFSSYFTGISIRELFIDANDAFLEDGEVEIKLYLDENVEYLFTNTSLIFKKTKSVGKVDKEYLVLDEYYSRLKCAPDGLNKFYYRDYKDNSHIYEVNTLRFDNVDFEIEEYYSDIEEYSLLIRIYKPQGMRKMLFTKDQLKLKKEMFKHSEEWSEFVVPLIKSLEKK